MMAACCKVGIPVSSRHVVGLQEPPRNTSCLQVELRPYLEGAGRVLSTGGGDGALGLKTSDMMMKTVAIASNIGLGICVYNNYGPVGSKLGWHSNYKVYGIIQIDKHPTCCHTEVCVLDENEEQYNRHRIHPMK